MSDLLHRDRVYDFLVPKVVDDLDLTHGTVLYMEDVSVSFDGFKAINNLNFYVETGELRCVIGPNGAGKTTMMDIITGKTRPDTGSVWFGQRMNLLRMSEPEIAEAGIGRKFQKPTVFENHSVFDNLEMAMAGPRGVWSTLTAKLSSEQQAHILDTAATIGLQDELSRQAGLLSHGQKQWLEIGMLLMQNPLMLLVDEPAAGMTHQEMDHTVELLTSLAGQHSVIVVEHDMDFVRALNSRVTVLHQGSVLAEGNMDQVQNDPQVIEVYLGEAAC
jgi:urea transport system ATP-binding protein